MIVWLASYPRSGNTLLRTVLKQTMGLGSSSIYEAASDDPNQYRPLASAFMGRQLLHSDWPEFYDSARSSNEICLVKTHDSPLDDSPAIYVVRDGRKASISYLHFDRSFRGGRSSLAGLIAGADACGDWTSHYRAWSDRPNTLVVRYEQLIEPSPELLGALATIVGFAGEMLPWVNPFRTLRTEDGAFFREGTVEWCGDAEWTPLIDSLFFSLHGQLMKELGYVSDSYGSDRPPVEMLDLAAGVRAMRDLKDQFCAAADERLKLIHELSRACEERLELIRKLSELVKTTSQAPAAELSSPA